MELAAAHRRRPLPIIALPNPMTSKPSLVCSRVSRDISVDHWKIWSRTLTRWRSVPLTPHLFCLPDADKLLEWQRLGKQGSLQGPRPPGAGLRFCIACRSETQLRPAGPSFWAETGLHLGGGDGKSPGWAWGQAWQANWLASGEAERNRLLEGLLQVPQLGQPAMI